MLNPSSKNKQDNKYAIFGGTFDPVHGGHITAIRFLLRQYPLVIIAPTLHNPWKLPPQATLEQRLCMLRLTLEAEQLVYAFFPETKTGLTISTFPYTYTEELLAFTRSNLSATAVWAIGKDEEHLVKKWKNFDQLDLEIEPIKIEIPIHSSDVRQLREIAHPAIKEYIEINSLYQAESPPK